MTALLATGVTAPAVADGGRRSLARENVAETHIRTARTFLAAMVQPLLPWRWLRAPLKAAAPAPHPPPAATEPAAETRTARPIPAAYDSLWDDSGGRSDEAGTDGGSDAGQRADAAGAAGDARLRVWNVTDRSVSRAVARNWAAKAVFACWQLRAARWMAGSRRGLRADGPAPAVPLPAG